MKRVKRKKAKRPVKKAQSYARLQPLGVNKTDNIRRGEKHGNSKLTATEVKKIKRLLAKGESRRVIAEKFGVSARTISMIHHEVTWKHVTL